MFLVPYDLPNLMMLTNHGMSLLKICIWINLSSLKLFFSCVLLQVWKVKQYHTNNVPSEVSICFRDWDNLWPLILGHSQLSKYVINLLAVCCDFSIWLDITHTNNWSEYLCESHVHVIFTMCSVFYIHTHTWIWSSTQAKKHFI